MLKASKLFDVEDSFYLTDEECKFENKAVCNRITRCFYLTDEECK